MTSSVLDLIHILCVMYICVHVCVFGHTDVCVCTWFLCTHAHTRGWCQMPSSIMPHPTIFGDRIFHWTWNSFSPVLQCWDSRCTLVLFLAFSCGCWGSWHVFVLGWQALYWLNHIPILYLFYFEIEFLLCSSGRLWTWCLRTSFSPEGPTCWLSSH